MTTDFRQLQHLARALGLTYQQLLARYHADQGVNASRSGAIAWARRQTHVPDPGLVAAQAQQDLLASFADSRTRYWNPMPVALDPEMHAAISARANIDRKALALRTLEPTHYLDAALRTTPHHMAKQLACMEDFLSTRGGSLPQSRVTIYKMGHKAYGMVSNLRFTLASAGLPDSDTPVMLSALTAHFLDRLSAAPGSPTPLPAPR